MNSSASRVTTVPAASTPLKLALKVPPAPLILQSEVNLTICQYSVWIGSR